MLSSKYMEYIVLKREALLKYVLQKRYKREKSKVSCDDIVVMSAVQRMKRSSKTTSLTKIFIVFLVSYCSLKFSRQNV